jgi:hypothetical protein
MIYTIAVLNQFVKKVNPGAFIMVPQLISLENQANAAPPSWDVVKDSAQAAIGQFQNAGGMPATGAL